MSNSIWKTPEETPESLAIIAFYVDGYLFTSYYEPQYNQYGIFGASKVEKWCYMKELSSHILTLETELERTRKALDKAERLQKAVYLAIERFDDIRRLNDTYYDKPSIIATETTEEIKQLIKEPQ